MFKVGVVVVEVGQVIPAAIRAVIPAQAIPVQAILVQAIQAAEAMFIPSPSSQETPAGTVDGKAPLMMGLDLVSF